MAKSSAKATDDAGFEKAARKAAAAREAVVGARAAQAVLDAQVDELDAAVIADRAALKRVKKQLAERGDRLKKAGKQRESLLARGKKARKAATVAEEAAARAQQKLAGLTRPAAGPVKREPSRKAPATPAVTGSVALAKKAPAKKRRTPTA